jgi:sulfite exporter TauE/SafE
MDYLRAGTPGSPLILGGIALLVWVHRRRLRGDVDPTDKVQGIVAGAFLIIVGILQIARNGW